jgi:Family of unknown function (DUF6166)
LRLSVEGSLEGVTHVYSGNRRADGTTSVSVDGRPLDLRPGFRNQPATAFDWGYEGRGGPAQLALAILADHFADDDRARWHYEDFTRCVIRGLASESWTLTSAEIDAVWADSGKVMGSVPVRGPIVDAQEKERLRQPPIVQADQDGGTTLTTE